MTSQNSNDLKNQGKGQFVTISRRNQVTIPAHILKSLGLRSGDRLSLSFRDDRITLWPEPESYTDYFGGSLKNTWGSKEEIDEYLQEVRCGSQLAEEE